jgi:ribonuclease HI
MLAGCAPMAKKFYVVWRGVKTGVFHDWPSTLAQVDGFSGAQYKSYPTLPEAEAAFRSGAPARSPSATAASKPRVVRTDHADAVAASDTVIFCDGACEPNPGKAGSGMAVYRAGVLASLWYGAYNPAGTNNTAELNALLQALTLARTEIQANRTVQVRSDSSYGLNAVTKWAAGWKKRGWRKVDGEIKNLEVIQALYALYQEIEDDVKLQHISAHVGIEGNELADRMAMLAVERREVKWREYEEPLDVDRILKMRTG